METKKLIRCAIILAFPLLTYVFPNPEGLSIIGWHLIGIYVGTIVGIILKPYPTPAILLAAISITAIIIANTDPALLKITVDNDTYNLTQTTVLSGYKSGTTWLVFSALMLSSAFIITGLGKRIAYKLIGVMGQTSLRLGYVGALLDLLISPAMPSTTARGGGIMMPIMSSVAVSLDSQPNDRESSNKIGRYLMVNAYMVVKSTGYITFTAMATNAVALKLLNEVSGYDLDLSWFQWFAAASVPGLLILAITPLITYYLNKPTLRKIDNKTISKKGLEEMGPMTYAEKALAVIFITAILSWMFEDFLHLKSSTVAIAIMPLLVISGVVKWNDLAGNKGAWNIFTWYGGLLGLAEVLKESGFFSWLSIAMEHLITIDDSQSGMITIVILILSVAVRYLFASGGAYTASMIPVFAAVGIAAHCDPLLLGFGLMVTNCFGGMLTHYGSGPAVPLYGAGYNTIKSWWTTGGTMAVISLTVVCTVGFGWWRILQGMNVL